MSVPEVAETPPTDRGSASAWAWAILAVLPYWLPYAAHFTATDAVPTGYLYYDMPYYAANGRAVFERGNGLAGPNPYDPAPDAPAIYFHWFTWLIGFGVVRLGFDPGLWFLTLGAVGGLACARLTFALVRAVLPTRVATGPLFLLCMWGGGLLVAGRAAIDLAGGRPLNDLLAFDPFGGEWSLYWGRPIIYSTEAVYHALVAAAWLAVLRDRPIWSVGWAALLAATHPFSGIQLLCILGAWWVVRGRSDWHAPAWRIEGMLLGGVTAVFLTYYFGYLERFPQHRLIRVTWSLAWNTPLIGQVLAYGPVLLLAVARLWGDARRREPFRPGTGFLLTAAAVSLVLSNHHWLTHPHQPLHFTRGYVWLPLLLVGLPALQRWVTSFQGRAWSVALPALLALASTDNLVFLATATFRARGQEACLTAGEWDTLADLRDCGRQGVLVSEDARIGYLAATYSPTRPYVGHVFNTPDIQRRQAEVEGWLETGRVGPWLEGVDLVVVRRATFDGRRNDLGLGPPHWEILHENGEFVLLGRSER
jgi:hypothetical protein